MLPADHRPFIDKYFLRAKEILEKDNLNPIVKAQVFIRRGAVNVYGLREAIDIIKKYSDCNTLEIHALKDGDKFDGGECLMTIKAPIQSIIDLETMYLGVLSAETTLRNGERDINLNSIKENMSKIVELAEGRPVSYFGARHWRYDRDAEISKACFEAGAENCSTDAGAAGIGQEGIGTIPHALEAIYHWRNGLENAVFVATHAFEENIDESVPRIALVDYANMEILDSLSVAPFVNAIRIDTCGENKMQGEMQTRGVTIGGVYAIRKVLNDSGYGNVDIILSSGFGDPNKVKAFTDAEKMLGIRLFDGLGVGGVFVSRAATMDIIEVEGQEIHKVGRLPKDTSRLKRII